MSLCPNKVEDPLSEVNLRKIFYLLLIFCSNKKVPEIRKSTQCVPIKSQTQLSDVNLMGFFLSSYWHFFPINFAWNNNTIRQWFPNCLIREALFRKKFYDGAPEAYRALWCKVMFLGAFLSSTGSGDGK